MDIKETNQDSLAALREVQELSEQILIQQRESLKMLRKIRKERDLLWEFCKFVIDSGANRLVLLEEAERTIQKIQDLENEYNRT